MPDKLVQLFDDQFRLAVYVGDHHPSKVSVETARADLGIRGEEFTKMKDALITMGVLVQSRGLMVVPNYNGWMVEQSGGPSAP